MVETARKRRPQERAEITKKKLIDVAIQEFSERGFDAVTLRDIEVRAGVQRNLVSYHFGNKEEMWKAAVTQMTRSLQEFTTARVELGQDLSLRERLAYNIRSYVRYASMHPELNRLMVQEGKQESWRMRFLMDQMVRPGMKNFRRLVADELDWDEDLFVHWWYVFVGGGAMIFSLAPEAKLLFDKDVHEEEIVTRHANMMVEFLLSISKPTT